MYNWHHTWNGQAAEVDDLRLDAFRTRKFAATVQSFNRRIRLAQSAAMTEQKATEIAKRIGYRR